MEKVSIGLPVYNGQAYLKYALEALLRQDYSNIELIISDNASTDDTPAICHEYSMRHSRLRYERNATTTNVFLNFRKVFELSTGEYFMWASSDDLWANNYVSALVELLQAYSHAVLAFSPVQRIDQFGRQLGKPTQARSDHPRTNAVGRVIKNLQRNSCSIFYGLFRRQILEKTSVFPELGIPPDLALLAEISCYGSFAGTSKTIFYRRKHTQQVNRLRDDVEHNQAIVLKWCLDRRTQQWMDSLYLSGPERKKVERVLAKEIFLHNKGGSFVRKAVRALKRKKQFFMKPSFIS